MTLRGIVLWVAALVGSTALSACSGAAPAATATAEPTTVVVPASGAQPTTTPARTATSRPTVTPLPPPYVASAAWVVLPSGRSLQVRPTPAGRLTPGDDDEAWAEVLRLQPDAALPGMRAQFDCHWTYARLVDPDKTSWNLEPWRPVVSADEMVRTRCNPGGAEE